MGLFDSIWSGVKAAGGALAAGGGNPLIAGGVALGGSLLGSIMNKPKMYKLQPYLWPEMTGGIKTLQELGEERIEGASIPKLGVSDILAPTYRAAMSTAGAAVRRGGDMSAAERRGMMEGAMRTTTKTMAPATAQAYGIVSERDIARAELEMQRRSKELLAQIEANRAAGNLALGAAEYRTGLDVGNIQQRRALHDYTSGWLSELGQFGAGLLSDKLTGNDELKRMLYKVMLGLGGSANEEPGGDGEGVPM